MPKVNKGAARKATRKGPDTGPVRLSRNLNANQKRLGPPGHFGSRPTGKPLPKHK